MDLSQRIIRTAVDWSGAGLLLADYLAGRFTYRSRDEWCLRIISGEITLNGQTVSPETLLALHDRIEYRPGDIAEPPADLNYRTVYEDEKILVIDKPGNLCMHPAGPFFKHTLWHLLSTRYGTIHFVNRLDRETSGVLLAAKDPKSARLLSKNISAKRYQVIVHGTFPDELEARGFLQNANSIIRKKRRFVREMPDAPPFESAATYFRKVASSGELSLLEATLFTGRMHQIRATLFSLGYPVAGDKLYGPDEKFYLKQRSGELSDADRKKLLISRQALHSAFLEFTHPETAEKCSFTAALPAEMSQLIFKKGY
ncbi:MAG: RluA family pseudouridine synthase [Lentisphaeria bacterium]|nr:RluA family pseudouridine synthase [Lentisphaeria bacterium]